MRYAVVTGGTGFLGSSIKKSFSKSQWSIEAPGSDELDVCDNEKVQTFFAQRSVDLLVCAAGMTADSLLARTSQANWDRIWAVNFQGAKACAQAAIPAMKSRGAGHIVFISSYSAIRPPLGQIGYASAKAALMGLTSDLAKRYGPCNIRVNCVLPGFLETRMTAELSAKRRAEIMADHCLGRFNTCDDVAAFIHFLHDHQPHTSGQVFQLDSRA